MAIHSDDLRGRLPFLQRNWLKSLAHITRPSPTHHHYHHADKDDGPPPRKRRKVHFAEPPPEAPARGVDLNGFALPPPLSGQPHRSLRVAVTAISHKDAPSSQLGELLQGHHNSSTANVENVKARCKLTVTGAVGNPRDTQILYCRSQPCLLQTPLNMDDRQRLISEICLEQPFHVPESDLLVVKEDGSMDLADYYNVTVEVDSIIINNNETSSPLTILANHSASGPHQSLSQRLSLFTTINDIFSLKPGCSATTPRRLSFKQPGRKEHTHTDYVMYVDIRCYTGTQHAPSENGTGPGETTRSKRKGETQATNGIHSESPAAEDPRTDQEGHDSTHSRSLRARSEKVYNLKVLSAKAQGKEFRKRKRTQMEPQDPAESRVIYTLPIGGVVSLESSRCLICQIAHANNSQLRLHLASNHTDLKFIHSKDGPVTVFEVQHLGEQEQLEPTNKPGLNKSQSPDLDNVVGKGPGISWFADRKTLRAQAKRYSDSPPISKKDGRNGRHSSSRSSTETSRASTPARARSPRRARPKPIIVPESKHKFFDPISRAPLEPGTVYTEREPDEKWLIQRHAESMNDFTDMSQIEKDMCVAWDVSLNRAGVNSQAYLPAAWLEFVRANAPWIVSSRERRLEFAKHYSYLVARDALDEKTVMMGLEFVKEAGRQHKKGKGKGVPVPEPERPFLSPENRTSKGGCTVCGFAVLGPRLLVCDNVSCERRLYHKNCAAPTAHMKVDEKDWLCNSCVEARREK